jgi:hypothetical protein
MYVLCSECAYLIDLAEGNRPQRDVESVDLIRHIAEEHSAWWHKRISMNGRGSPAGLGPTSLKAEAEPTLDESKLCHGARVSVQGAEVAREAKKGR